MSPAWATSRPPQDNQTNCYFRPWKRCWLKEEVGPTHLAYTLSETDLNGKASWRKVKWRRLVNVAIALTTSNVSLISNPHSALPPASSIETGSALLTHFLKLIKLPTSAERSDLRISFETALVLAVNSGRVFEPLSLNVDHVTSDSWLTTMWVK